MISLIISIISLIFIAILFAAAHLHPYEEIISVDTTMDAEVSPQVIEETSKIEDTSITPSEEVIEASNNTENEIKEESPIIESKENIEDNNENKVE